MSVDNEMYEDYESALEAYRKFDYYAASDYEEWSAFIEVLRKGFQSANKLSIENIIPEVIYDQRGVEWQIDVEPSDDRVMFEESGEKTIANMVFRELQVARARQEWSKDDSFEEFSDLDDDEEELDRTVFENAWLSMEKDRQREFYENFIKGQVPPKKKETDTGKVSEGSEAPTSGKVEVERDPKP